MNSFLSDIEIKQFSNIYYNNYLNIHDAMDQDRIKFGVSRINDTELNSANYSLLKGVPLIQIPNQRLININIDYLTSPDKFVNNQNVYTQVFSKHMKDINVIITNESLSDSTKYALLGKLLNKFKCNNNNFNSRFIKFILRYINTIAHNKYLLLEKMGALLIKEISSIGKCDYANWEGIANKEVEDAFRSGEVLSNIPVVAGNAAEYVASVMASMGNAVSVGISSARGTSSSLPFNSEYNKTIIPNKYKLDPLRDLVKLIRTELMTMHEYVKNKFCSKLELTRTIQKYPDSAFWLRTPGLVAITTSAVNCGAAFSLNDFGDTTSLFATHLQNSAEKYSAEAATRIASIVNTVCGPLLGLIVGLSLGTLVESQFFKDLRSSRIIYLTFLKLIKNHYPDLTLAECSYRGNSPDYMDKFMNSKRDIDSYYEEATQYYDDSVKNLNFYLFVYDYICRPFEPNVEGNVEDVEENVNEDVEENVNEVDTKNVERTIAIFSFLNKINRKTCASDISTSAYKNTYYKFNMLPEEQRIQMLQDINVDALSKFTSGNCTANKLLSSDFSAITQHIQSKLHNTDDISTGDAEDETVNTNDISTNDTENNYDAVFANLAKCRIINTNTFSNYYYDEFLKKDKATQIKIIDQIGMTPSNTIKCKTPMQARTLLLGLGLGIGGKKSRKLRKTQKRRQNTYRHHR
jgi:hypothetical protein